jgi:hypothetical protein
MFAVNTLVGLLVVSCALIVLAIERRNARRRRLQLLGRAYFDDRDTLERFRRMIRN